MCIVVYREDTKSTKMLLYSTFFVCFVLFVTS